MQPANTCDLNVSSPCKHILLQDEIKSLVAAREYFGSICVQFCAPAVA